MIRGRSAVWFFLCAALAGCGPKVFIQPQFEQQQVQTVALLPIEFPEGTREERVRFLHAAFVSELEARGYRLLEDAIVQRYCATATCEDRGLLAQRYPVGAFIKIKIEDIDRNNFVVGFYNAIKGQLEAQDAEGATLVKVEHTESKRGGILFDSGQVIQAVRESYENYGDWGFNALASAFAEEVVSELPQVDAGGSASAAPRIQNVTIGGRSGSARRICASAAPGLRGLLLLNGRMTNLRETSPGVYCGIYRFPAGYADALRVEVELRSPFGAASRRQLTLEPAVQRSADASMLDKMVSP